MNAPSGEIDTTAATAASRQNFPKGIQTLEGGVGFDVTVDPKMVNADQGCVPIRAKAKLAAGSRCGDHRRGVHFSSTGSVVGQRQTNCFRF